MGWSNINNHKLQAMRKLLMLDVKEAAELIGNCSARSWQRWESRHVPVPDDIDTEIYACIQRRNEIINDLTEQQATSDEPLVMRYYQTFDDWQQDYPHDNKVCWRIHQAAVAFIFSEGGNVELK